MEQHSVSGLTHQWKISDTVIDIVTGKNITLNMNGVRGLNRYNTSSDSAFHFNPDGWLHVEPSVYFDPLTGGFTVMAWIKTESLQTYSLLDCGLGLNNENIIIELGSNIIVTIVNGNITQLSYTGVGHLPQPNSWYHVSVSLNIVAVTMSIFGNGVFYKSVHYFPEAGMIL